MANSIKPTHKERLISLERLKEVLLYDPDTGVFTWKVSTALRVKAGDTAGCMKSGGYVQFNVDRRQYRAHRLAWFYMTGEWPQQDMDHINGIRHDNRFANLRPSTRSQNQHNQRAPRSNNKSGFLGVYRSNNRFRALINVEGKKIHLGYFDDPESAHDAYLEAKRKHHAFCSI